MDYGKLADKLKDSESPARESQGGRKTDPVALFESVKAHVGREIEKANVELRKRRLGTIERVFMPSFHGKLCLTLGSELLCTVELQEAYGRIAVVILGPPNRIEIARKEYLPEGAPAVPPPSESTVKTAYGYGPEQIAVDIVSGLIMREFA